MILHLIDYDAASGEYVYPQLQLEPGVEYGALFTVHYDPLAREGSEETFLTRLSSLQLAITPPTGVSIEAIHAHAGTFLRTGHSDSGQIFVLFTVSKTLTVKDVLEGFKAELVDVLGTELPNFYVVPIEFDEGVTPADVERKQIAIGEKVPSAGLFSWLNQLDLGKLSKEVLLAVGAGAALAIVVKKEVS